MKPFTNHSTTRFCADLMGAVRRMDGPIQKAQAIVAGLEAFLSALSYAKVASLSERTHKTDRERFLVPCPVFVHLIDAAGHVIETESSRDELPQPKGAAFPFKISRDLTLVVEGAGPLFEKIPWLVELCSDLAEYARPHLEDLAIHSRGTSTDFLVKQEVPAGLLKPDTKWFEPLVETLDLLTDCEPGNGGIPPRWAWLAKAGLPGKKPYIYLYWPKAKETPTVVNPDGSEAIIHCVLREGTPRLTWNYAQDERWKIPEDVKEAFKRRARTAEFPHLLYVPVLKWMALQISFGPQDDPLVLLDRAYRLSELVPVMLLNCFQDALFHLLIDLFGNPAVQPHSRGLSEYGRGEAVGLIQFVLDAYPVPRLNVTTTHEGYPMLESVGTADPIGRTFAQHGNGAVKQAFDVAMSQAETRDYKRFGSTVMGMIHTLKRPVDNMLSYTQRIEAEVALQPDLKRRTSEMIQSLDRLGVFAALEVESLKQLFSPETEPATSVRAVSILEVLQAAKYDPRNLPAKLDLTAVGSVSVEDPVKRLPVNLTWDLDAAYPLPAGPMALIIAELVDNAAKYLFSQPDLKDGSAVDVTLMKSGITVCNPIKEGEKLLVEAKLGNACETVGRSLNRVLQLSGLIGLSITWEFKPATRLRFLCRPLRL